MKYPMTSTAWHAFNTLWEEKLLSYNLNSVLQFITVTQWRRTLLEAKKGSPHFTWDNWRGKAKLKTDTFLWMCKMLPEGMLFQHVGSLNSKLTMEVSQLITIFQENHEVLVMQYCVLLRTVINTHKIGLSVTWNSKGKCNSLTTRKSQ